MINIKEEKRLKRKMYKKAKRKAIRPWKGLSIISAILSIVLIITTVFFSMFDNTIAAFFGGNFTKLVNEDPNAIYFESDFSSPEKMIDYGLELCKQVEAEGATLLLNENNALPLKRGAKVSCFSNSSVNLVYGGTGSGNIDVSTADNLRTALEKADIQVNTTLWDFYESKEIRKYARTNGGTVSTSSAIVSEVPWDLYTDDVKQSVGTFNDAAIIVLSRVGGEGADLDYQNINYLALDQNEKDLLANVRQMKDVGIVKKIVILINSANALQVDFLKNNEYGVDACLWIGDVGISGINAVADILAGTTNPSGSLVDTYCYDNYSSPAMMNFTPIIYEGYQEGLIPDTAKSYMIYQEGIYVGYKYYETRYEDYVKDSGNAGEYDYRHDVAFPFGYGLSYTEFEFSDMDTVYNPETDQYEISVKVTNKGEMAGKRTVQVYVQTPYTSYDIANHIEKPAIALCGFAKSDMIESGKSQIVKVFVNRRELASYDAYGAGTYVLDAGDYYLTVGADAHDAVNNILAAKGYTKANTSGKMDFDGNIGLVYCWKENKFDQTTYAKSKNGTEVKNQLSNSDINLYQGNDTSISYLSRSNWQGTFPNKVVQLELTQQMIHDLQIIQYDPAHYLSMEMPVLGAKNGLKLYDMIGLSYDDPKWNDLLDQLTFNEMVTFIGDAFHWTMPVKSVEAPGTRDENGPQGLTASLISSSKTELEATAFTSEDVMAATFNVDLMTEIGRVIGNNCVTANIACLYGPGNNIHRTPYGGRNFEYYSEDGFLSGIMSAAEVAAIQAKGVHVVMKHFALNDCEQDRLGLGVWLPEQAAREIYLKAFQAPFEEGNANGVMVAYTRWGCIWSGGNKGLITGILREEWGSNGMTITDNVLTEYVNGVDGIMSGVSIFDAMMPYVTNLLPKYKDDPVVVNAMKEACHHNLYAIANSAGMNGVGANTTIKVVEPRILSIVKTLAFVFCLLLVISTVMFVIKYSKFKKTEEYIDYMNDKKGNK